MNAVSKCKSSRVGCKSVSTPGGHAASSLRRKNPGIDWPGSFCLAKYMLSPACASHKICNAASVRDAIPESWVHIAFGVFPLSCSALHLLLGRLNSVEFCPACYFITKFHMCIVILVQTLGFKFCQTSDSKERNLKLSSHRNLTK